MGSGQSTYKPPEVQSKYYPAFFESMPSMQGKVVAITGCTSGTGLIAATAVAKKGGEVIMLNRKSERAEAAEQKVKGAAPGAKVSTIACDLTSLDAVRTAAADLKKACPGGLDVLCCNAGVMANPDQATVDGYDIQMQTNHLSHFLLVKELMPSLEQAASSRGEARVVAMSSGARLYPSTPLKAEYYGKNGGNLGGDGNSMLFGGARWERYHQTKLANCVFTYCLDERFKQKSSKVKALVAHPGLSATNLQVESVSTGGMNSGWFINMFMGSAMSPEDGTVGLLMAMCKTDAQSGDFYGPKGMNGPSVKLTPEKMLQDPKSMNILWEESSKAAGGEIVIS